MKNIFVYGTLMFDEVWQQLIPNRYSKIDAELEDYIRLKVREENYPGIIPSGGSKVTGELIFNVSKEDIKQLDIFEGEYYQRDQVTVISGTTTFQAETYVFRKRYHSLLSNEVWEVETFKKSGLSSFLASYKHFNQ